MGNVVTDEKLDWKRAGMAVAARRAALGFRTQEDAAAAADVGVQTWREIEGGKRGNYRPALLARVATALDWPTNMVSRIAAGEDPPEDRSLDPERLRRVEDRLEELHELLRVVLDIVRPPVDDHTTGSPRAGER